MIIDELQKRKINDIAEKYDLQLLVLFGSRVKGSVRAKSDYDVAYMGSKALSLDEEARLILDLTSVFKSENVDLASMRNASPLLLYHITKDGQAMYENEPGLFTEQYLYARRVYDETLPLYEVGIKNIRQRLMSL